MYIKQAARGLKWLLKILLCPLLNVSFKKVPENFVNFGMFCLESKIFPKMSNNFQSFRTKRDKEHAT